MSRPRWIVIDGVPSRYSRRHGHVAGRAGPRLCEEVLRAWPEDRSQGTLVLRFRDKQGGVTLAGGGWADRDSLDGSVRVTSPETFCISYLAPRLAAFGLRHPGLTLELVPSGEVLDLGRRQAEIAVRCFRSKHENLVLRRAGEVAYGFYASPEYLARRTASLRLRCARPLGTNVASSMWSISRLCFKAPADGLLRAPSTPA